MQCAKPHIGSHKQALKRVHAMHKITQGSINRLWTELIKKYLMSPMNFEKHYPYSKLNVYDKLFVFSIPI
jgi:mRNA-degrading endonuclease HigB of HigAB toxin-antitoxin module